MRTGEHKAASVLSKRLRNSGSVIALSVALGFSLSAHAGALPSSGHYVSGKGEIGKAGTSLTVKQSSTTGIIDWNKFSVGSKNSVTFDNGRGATLNRVTGGNLSTIAGSLHATGSLYLMNNAGVIVSGTGRVVTGGDFIATSGNIGTAFDSDSRFKAGRGKIVNKGTIVSGGSTTLVGSEVHDTGTIHATTVDLEATHKLAIDGTITAHNGDGGSGTVMARGRTIVIGTDGDIDASASSAGQKGGTISVVARGTAKIAGRLSANGGANGAGGFVETSGEHVHVADGTKVSTVAANGKTGTWLIDPQDFTIAASGGDITGATIETNLGSDNVLIQSIAGSKSGNGDIFVDEAITWSSQTRLTLDAYRNIVFNAAVIDNEVAGGTGGVTLVDADHTQTSGVVGVNDGTPADGDLIFNAGGRIAFTHAIDGTSVELSINGNAYTLADDIAELTAAISVNGGGGFYAFANNYNASGDNSGAGYTSSPIPTTFTGTFEGLGNTISNLTIKDVTASGTVGLFSNIGTGGVVRDIGLTNVKLTAADMSTAGGIAGSNAGTISGSYVTGTVSAGANTSAVGGLVGSNASSGVLTDDYATASVSIGDASAPVDTSTDAGGLVGKNSGTIMGSHATGGVADKTVSYSGTPSSDDDDANLGGFVGFNSGTISTSYATGAVTGIADDDVGGFVGYTSAGTISNSYATGMVVGATGKAGGFAGNAIGTISSDHATGAVSATGDADIGGLIGYNDGATISQSFATGAVSSSATDAVLGGLIGFQGTGSVSTSYASGSVTYKGTGGEIGGLIGNNESGVTTSFATGKVSAGADSVVGGLIGYNTGASAIVSHSYATGAVSAGAAATVGGFVGSNDSLGTIDESYSLGAAKDTASGNIVGGFAGNNSNTAGISASVGNYYNITANTGAAIGSDADTTGSDVHGLALSDMRTVAKFTEWTDFSTTPGGSGWVIVDQDGSLNNVSGAAGGTTPMLLSEYSTTITNAHQLQLMELAVFADYTLANNIDASGTAGGDIWSSAGFIPVGGNALGAFSGNFNGNGNSINGLTINDGVNQEVGLFGLTTTGTITDVTLSNVSVQSTAGAKVGALIGWNDGTVSDSSVSGSVSASGSVAVGGLIGFSDFQISGAQSSATVKGLNNVNGQDVGGLIGANAGTITLSSASGAVSTSGGINGNVGGLVGINETTVADSYATGKVSGDVHSNAGGLVGYNTETVEGSFATGAVSTGDGGTAGGFFGENNGTILESYALGAVSGASASQGVSVGGFGGLNSNAGTISQSYSTGAVSATGPESFLGGFLGGNQNTSGNSLQSSYFDTQTTGVTLGVVSAGGGSIAGVTGKTTAQMQAALPTDFDPADWKIIAGKSFAYLDWQAPSGTPEVISGTISGSSNKGVAVGVLVNGTAAVPLAAMASGANGYYYELLAPGAISNSGSNVLIYEKVSDGGNVFDQGATGSLTGVNIASNTLIVNSSATSESAMLAAMLNALGNHTSSDYLYTSGGAFTPGVNLYLNLSASSFDLNGSLALGTGDLHLKSAGKISEESTASITAAELTGSSAGATNLTSALNKIAKLEAFTAGSTFSLTDDVSLAVDGAVSSGSANTHLTTVGSGHNIGVNAAVDANAIYLISSGTISEDSAGDLDAAELEGSSVGAASLTSAANTITKLEGFTAGGNFSLTDDASLAVVGAVSSGSANMHLTTVGSGHNIAVNAKVKGADIYLVSAGGITEAGAGDLDATELFGSSASAALLTSSINTIAKLESFTAGGTFSLTDDASLAMDGAVSSGVASTHLTTVGASHKIGINAVIDAANIYLVSSGAISEDSAGALDATELAGSSVGATLLTSTSNTFTDLEGFTTSGNNKFELTDAHTLAVHGAVSVGKGTLDLTTVGSVSNLDIDSAITGGTINLAAGGKAMENSSGAITASTILNVTANTGIDLTSSANKIKKLGTHTTNSGPNKVTL